MAIAIRCKFVSAQPTWILDEVCRIYEASIPASERKPVEAIRAMATRPDYRLIAAVREGVVLGFAALFAPPEESFALLEYMAVDEASRGGGIGADLFRAAVDAVSPRNAMLLVEVEAEVGEGDDREQRRRRQAFYRRLGCRRVAGLAYELPLHVAGRPPAMELMVYPPAMADGRLDSRTVEAALHGIYEKVYDQPADDPRIPRMIAGLTDPILLD
jgi:GNAT superfamily N-acetyltransferase